MRHVGGIAFGGCSCLLTGERLALADAVQTGRRTPCPLDGTTMGLWWYQWSMAGHPSPVPPKAAGVIP